MNSRENIQHICLEDWNTVGVGIPLDVSGYRDIVVEVSGDASANMTARFQGGCSNVLQDRNLWLGTSGTVSAPWDYVEAWDANSSAAAIPGTTGITVSGAATTLYYINSDALNWVNFRVLTYSAGSVTVKIYAAQGH